MIDSGIKAQRSYIDPFYKPTYKGAYYLSVLLGRDALSAAVLDLKDNTYLALEEFIFEGIQNHDQLREEVASRFRNAPIFSAEFQKIHVGITNEYNSLVPEALYDEESKVGLFEFTQGKKEDYRITEDHLINIRARNIYALPRSLEEVISEIFPMAEIRHFSTSLIDGLALKYKQVGGEQVIVHLQYSHFEMLFFKNGQLQYYNSFPFTTAEDFIYYTLFAFEQLGLSNEEVPVEVLGETDSESPAFNILHKYVRKVSFGERPRVLNYSTALESIPSNQFYNLFQQFLCA